MSKLNIVVPCNGRGQRMIDGGYHIPKPMLVCGPMSILEWSLLPLNWQDANLVFIVRQEHVHNFSIDRFLKDKFPGCVIVISTKDTSGATETVFLAKNYLLKDQPLIIYTPDTTFAPHYFARQEDYENDGFILTFKANSPNYSYCVTNKEGRVCLTAEKQVVSDAASVGLYGFKSVERFFRIAEPYVAECKKLGKEAHICPLFNELIRDGGVVTTRSVEDIHIMGTPDEFKFVENVSFKYLRNRKFALCSDHSGFALKKKIIASLDTNLGSDSYIDFGCYSERDCDYNHYVEAVCDYVNKEKDFFGIGCCRSGQGVNICANKQAGIRSCLIRDQESASLAIRHNAANFFAMPESNFLAQSDTFLECVMHVLTTETFSGGRHQSRLMSYANS